MIQSNQISFNIRVSYSFRNIPGTTSELHSFVLLFRSLSLGLDEHQAKRSAQPEA